MGGPMGPLERDRELDLLAAATAAAAAGGGLVVLIEGPAGIGKSALLDINGAKSNAWYLSPSA